MYRFVMTRALLAVLSTVVVATTSKCSADKPVYQGMPLSTWTKLAKDNDPKVRRNAISCLLSTVSTDLEKDKDYEYVEKSVPVFAEAHE